MWLFCVWSSTFAQCAGWWTIGDSCELNSVANGCDLNDPYINWLAEYVIGQLTIADGNWLPLPNVVYEEDAYDIDENNFNITPSWIDISGSSSTCTMDLEDFWIFTWYGLWILLSDCSCWLPTSCTSAPWWVTNIVDLDTNEVVGVKDASGEVMTEWYECNSTFWVWLELDATGNSCSCPCPAVQVTWTVEHNVCLNDSTWKILFSWWQWTLDNYAISISWPASVVLQSWQTEISWLLAWTYTVSVSPNGYSWSCDSAFSITINDGLDPDDWITCTTDSCNSVTWQITNIPNNQLCDNWNVCDWSEVCNATLWCESEPNTEPNCNDNDVCTDDSCDATNGCQNIYDQSNGSQCVPRYWCNENGQCIEMSNGWYVWDDTCNNACVTDPEEKYGCNENGQCVEDENGWYSDTGCNNACVIIWLCPTPNPNEVYDETYTFPWASCEGWFQVQNWSLDESIQNSRTWTCEDPSWLVDDDVCEVSKERCGDGIIQEDQWEECEVDENGLFPDACTNECVFSCRWTEPDLNDFEMCPDAENNLKPAFDAWQSLEYEEVETCTNAQKCSYILPPKCINDGGADDPQAYLNSNPGAEIVYCAEAQDESWNFVDQLNQTDDVTGQIPYKKITKWDCTPWVADACERYVNSECWELDDERFIRFRKALAEDSQFCANEADYDPASYSFERWVQKKPRGDSPVISLDKEFSWSWNCGEELCELYVTKPPLCKELNLQIDLDDLGSNWNIWVTWNPSWTTIWWTSDKVWTATNGYFTASNGQTLSQWLTQWSLQLPDSDGAAVIIAHVEMFMNTKRFTTTTTCTQEIIVDLSAYSPPVIDIDIDIPDEEKEKEDEEQGDDDACGPLDGQVYSNIQSWELWQISLPENALCDTSWSWWTSNNDALVDSITETDEETWNIIISRTCKDNEEWNVWWNDGEDTCSLTLSDDLEQTLSCEDGWVNIWWLDTDADGNLLINPNSDLTINTWGPWSNPDAIVSKRIGVSWSTSDPVWTSSVTSAAWPYDTSTYDVSGLVDGDTITIEYRVTDANDTSKTVDCSQTITVDVDADEIEEEENPECGLADGMYFFSLSQRDVTSYEIPYFCNASGEYNGDFAVNDWSWTWSCTKEWVTKSCEAWFQYAYACGDISLNLDESQFVAWSSVDLKGTAKENVSTDSWVWLTNVSVDWVDATWWTTVDVPDSTDETISISYTLVHPTWWTTECSMEWPILPKPVVRLRVSPTWWTSGEVSPAPGWWWWSPWKTPSITWWTSWAGLGLTAWNTWSTDWWVTWTPTDWSEDIDTTTSSIDETEWVDTDSVVTETENTFSAPEIDPSGRDDNGWIKDCNISSTSIKGCPKSNDFSDIQSSVLTAKLDYVQNACIFNGPSDTNAQFRRDDQTTVEWFLKTMVRLFGLVEGSDVANSSLAQVWTFSRALVDAKIMTNDQRESMLRWAPDTPITKDVALGIITAWFEFKWFDSATATSIAMNTLELIWESDPANSVLDTNQDFTRNALLHAAEYILKVLEKESPTPQCEGEWEGMHNSPRIPNSVINEIWLNRIFFDSYVDEFEARWGEIDVVWEESWWWNG